MGDLMKTIWKDEADNVRSIALLATRQTVYAKVGLGNVNKAAFADNHDTGAPRSWLNCFTEGLSR